MAAITISRQYGSGGRKVALRVSELLGWSLFDKRLMMDVMSDVGLSSQDIVDFTEDDYKVKSFWDRLFGSSGLSDPSGTYAVTGQAVSSLATAQMDQEGTVRLVNRAIEKAYERGNVVIVGRGGQVVLRDKLDVIKVRVQAPMSTRIERLESYEGILRENAESTARDRDKAASKYMERFFGVDWNDPELYHLVINSEKLDTNAVADVIVSTTKQLLALT